MEVDDVETGQLLQRFGSMQTVDRSESIKQMRRLVGGDDALSESKATFYLEMSNWNVHAAVGHYFDLEATQGSTTEDSLPKMTFVRDVTVGEGEAIPPSTNFVKAWTIRNPNGESWPPGSTLRLASGHAMGMEASSVSVAPLAVGGTTNLHVQMRSPDLPGIYESQFRMSTPTGNYFGDPIWCILTVEPSGTMALTQQLNSFQAFAESPNRQLNPSVVGRPTSPTDATIAVVNTRNVLTRTVQHSDVANVMEDDEEMN
jgi:hypothetical protein